MTKAWLDVPPAFKAEQMTECVAGAIATHYPHRESKLHPISTVSRCERWSGTASIRW